MTHLDALYGISQQYNNSRSVRLVRSRPLAAVCARYRTE